MIARPDPKDKDDLSTMSLALKRLEEELGSDLHQRDRLESVCARLRQGRRRKYQTSKDTDTPDIEPGEMVEWKVDTRYKLWLTRQRPKKRKKP